MQKIKRQFQRILSIYPTSKGFGFVVMEYKNKLIDWGTTRIRARKHKRNKGCLKRAVTLMESYQPDAVILPASDDSSRCQRIRNLIKQIASKAKTRGLTVIIVTKQQVKQHFVPLGAKTKHQIAKLIALWHPPLRQMLPKPRKPWQSEDERMGVFGAVAVMYPGIRPEQFLAAKSNL